MTDRYMARAAKKTPRRVRFRLRDGRVLEGNVFLTEREFLAPFLATRKRCVNVTDVEWLGTGPASIEHLVLPTASVLWAIAVGGDTPLVQIPPAARPRPVELQLENGVVAHATLHIVPGQRLSDWFDAADPFIPVTTAVLRPRGTELGEAAVNRDAVCLMREVPAE